MKVEFLAWVMAALLVVGLSFSPGARADEAAVRAACTADNSPRLKEIYDRGVLHWAVGIAAPFAAKDMQGKYVGIEPENAAEFAGILGIDVEINNYSYDLLPPSLAAGKTDIVGAFLYITDKRKEVIDFSEPYQREGQVFVVLKSRTDLNSIEDLNKSGIKVVNNIGSGQVELSKRLLPNATHAIADMSVAAGGAHFLITGQYDVTMVDGASFPLSTKASQGAVKMIGTNGVVDGDVPPGDETIEPFDIGFGVAKGDPGFLACVNAYVAYLREDGRLYARYARWVKKMVE
ncbi:MAG: transporter substrate-binding domain-containing protein [Proteobacteria bacterium]|nr:transporter substrate-binding domain-containing protein [Pseudomonadota bacterium]